MDQEKTVKVFESKLEGCRRRGRPRWKWWEDCDKDLRDVRVKG